ncbi:MAG: hypothetical protein ACLTTO_10200 [Lachnospiraceae bacterium]
MEKRHISRVMLWETLYTAMLSLLLGIACGILFSKLVFLGLLKILKMNVVIGVEISAFTLAETVGLFAVIFLLIFFNRRPPDLHGTTGRIIKRRSDR